jgi:hypothetical protein
MRTRCVVQVQRCALAVWLALAAPAGAQSTALQLVPASSNVVENPIAIADARLGTEIRIRNAGSEPAGAPLRVHFVPLLVRRSDGKGVPAVWTRTGSAGDPNILQPSEEATFLLAASLPEAGVYDTFIETEDTSAALAGRIRVVVTRTAETLPRA